MKITWLQEKPAVLVEAEKAQRKPHPLMTILVRIVIALVISGIPSFVFLLFQHSETVFYWSSDSFVPATISSLLAVTAAILYVYYYEKRSFRSMGIVRNRGLRILLISIAALCALAFIGYTIAKQGSINSIGRAEGNVSSEFASIFTSLSASITACSFFLVSLANRMKLKYAVLIVCCLFPAYTILTMLLNVISFPDLLQQEYVSRVLTTVSVSILSMFFYLLLFLRTGHIWSVVGATIARVVIGGITYRIFGVVTGNLITLIVVIIAIALIIYWPRKNYKIAT